MPSENSQKRSGVRRQARECALQMLFAADLAEKGTFSTNGYWSEMGFAQVDPQSEPAVAEFVERVEKFGAEALSLRAVAKRQDDRSEKNQSDDKGRVTSRVDKIKRTAAAAGSVVKAFRAYIADVVAQNDPDMRQVHEEMENLGFIAKRFINDFESVPVTAKPPLSADDLAKFNEFKHLAETVPDDLLKNALPAIETLIAGVEPVRIFADKIVRGTLDNLKTVDERIKTRAEHWRIERMAIVDRNVLRLAVFEFLYEDTPHTVVINEALEIARQFSSFEATQFINGILDAIKLDLEKGGSDDDSKAPNKRSQASSS